MNDEVVFRQCCHADYEAVLDINRDIYNGLDYIPAMYHDLLDDEDTSLDLAIKGGKVVALSYKALCLGGTAVLKGAIRVHPDYQQQGIMHQLDKYQTEKFKKKHPRVSRIVYVTAVLEAPRFDECFKKNEARLLFKGLLIIMQNTTDIIMRSVKTEASKPNDHHVKLLDPRDMDWEKALSLFKSDVFLAGKRIVPYTATIDGIREALKSSIAMVSIDTDGNMNGICFCECIPAKIGNAAVLTYYGEDEESLKFLVVNQLNSYPTISPRLNLAMHLIFPLGLNKDSIREYLRTTLGFSTCPEPDDKCAILVEQMIDKI